SKRFQWCSGRAQMDGKTAIQESSRGPEPFSLANVSFLEAKMRRSHFLLAAAFTAVVLLAPLAWAQENATITGSVLDPTGAVIPNVAITLTNVATGQARESTSNSSGIYTFSNVGVGNFNLDATAPGFEKFSRTGIV